MIKKAFDIAYMAHTGKVKDDFVYNNVGGAGIAYKIEHGVAYLGFGGLNDIHDLSALGTESVIISGIGSVNKALVNRYLDIRKNLPSFSECTPLCISGYSLGGNLAFLHALTEQSRNIDSVYSFGSPKFVKVDARFLAEVKNDTSKFHRISVQNDPVSHSPLFGGWHHFGNALVLNTNNTKGTWKDEIKNISIGKYDSFANLLYLLIKSSITYNKYHDLETYKHLIDFAYS